MALFDIPKRAGKELDNDIAKKTKSSKTTQKIVRGGLLGRTKQITETIEKYLGKYRDDYIVINTTSALKEYIEVANAQDIIAIDTETTGLDPIQDKIVGFSIYTPTMKGAYIPINHVSYITGERVDNQLTEEEVKEVLKDLKAKVIMFNAKFDIRVIKNQIGVKLQCYWDCYLASRLMNENELKKKLKSLHQKYVLHDEEDEFSFDELFKGITFDKIPIDPGFLYATHDAVITHELYEFQKQYLYYDSAEDRTSRNGMNGVAWVFHNIEMPCVDAVVEMEDNGVEIDLEYSSQLSTRYHALLEEKLDNCYKELSKYDNAISKYLDKHKEAKIDNPINISSPTQIAILLYDILGVEPVDKRKPRGTGEEILRKIDLPICNAILEVREVEKLLSTYIDKLPTVINPNDKRIHCSFNQYGADTGRFSSSDPNLQNIPSHNKDIRPMFKATSEDYLIVSENNTNFSVYRWDYVNTPNGFIVADKLVEGDYIMVEDDGISEDIIVSKIERLIDNNLLLYYS